MRISGFAGDLLTFVPFILVGVAALGAIVWFVAGDRGGMWSKVTAWLGFVTLTLWIGSAAAFVGLHLLFFLVGSDAALAGLVFTAIFMLLMPFGWAVVIARRHAPAPPPASPAAPAKHA